MSQTSNDHSFMEMAARVAARGLGRVSPNPSVGCVIVNQQNEVIAIARTADGGRPHAEAQALKIAGSRAQGATAYVTLEPCAHEGSTPSCARLLAEAGIARVVVACIDPDPRTAGKGSAYLEQQSIGVDRCDEARAWHVLEGYLSRQTERRPAITLKVAVSANGFMRTPEGQSPQITGELSRRWVHGLRSRHDVLITGSGTVSADNPQMTCRLPLMRSPECLVLDRSGNFPPGCHLDRSGVTIYTQKPISPLQAATRPFAFTQDDQVDIMAVLGDLAETGVNRILVEAGPRLARAFWRTGAVDQLAILMAPHHLPMEGSSDLAYIGIDDIPTTTMHLYEDRPLGADRLIVWRRKTDGRLEKE